MKYNLYEAFDHIEIENADKIGELMPAAFEHSITDRVKAKALAKLGKKRKPHYGRILALAAAIAVFISSMSVGAAVYFKPDSTLSQFITYSDEIDMSTLGQDVNVTAEYQEQPITLTQVLSDNITTIALFKCPELDGKYVVPHSVAPKVNGRHYISGYGEVCRWYPESNIAYLAIDGLRNIKSGDQVTFECMGITLYNKNNEDDAIEIQLDQKDYLSFEFTANRAKVTKKLPTDGISIKSRDGKGEYDIKKLQISPIGLYIDYKIIGDDRSIIDDEMSIAASGTPDEAFTIIEMRDGTKYTDKPESYDFIAQDCGGSPTGGEMNYAFKNVINIDDIQSITIDGCILYKAE